MTGAGTYSAHDTRVKFHINRLKGCPCVRRRQHLRHLKIRVICKAAHHREIAEGMILLLLPLEDPKRIPSSNTHRIGDVSRTIIHH
jgi:hypothetical protein